MNIKIIYDGKLNKELDSELRRLFKSSPFNFKWIGQGYDFKDNKRDIEFEYRKKGEKST